MDQTRRSIIISLIGLVVVIGLAVLAALLIPFRVNEGATVQDFTGVIERITPDDERTQYEASLTSAEVDLATGERLVVHPGSTAALTFFENGGRANMTGPGTLTLVEVHRRATLPGHASDNFNRDYVLTLKQKGGSVHYYFSDTEPAFDDIDITLHLPNGNYTPDTPCWLVEISDEGVTTTLPFECP
ncbi:MAG: hypothetical protein GYB65_12860 [Chloroflexi bacterium]|nr:hypothetical protein [Chloroflexota bacterium]